ncbi:hypothetical protein RB195_009632 [Necator americanus]|uniref:Reverse transcriptase domain-containing protein n=1 Tax=Necator americanus TaxID=51031 RepID=A0ABR1CUZ3_NECAM
MDTSSTETNYFILKAAILKILLFAVGFINVLEEFLILTFNIHRVLIFVRPRWIIWYYVISSAPMLAFSIYYGVAQTNGSSVIIVMVSWYSTVVGALMLWSIRGFLRAESSRNIAKANLFSNIWIHFVRNAERELGSKLPLGIDIDVGKAFLEFSAHWKGSYITRPSKAFLKFLKIIRPLEASVKDEGGRGSLGQPRRPYSVLKVRRGVRQGDTISPKIFTSTLENATRKLEWDDMVVKLDGRQPHHFRFADDIVLITPSISQTERMLTEFDEICGCIGLQLNLQKTTFMRNGWVSDAPFTLNGTNISECASYVYLGLELNMMNDRTPELGRRRQAVWGAYKSIEDVMKKTRNTRLRAHLFNTTVLPALTCASETRVFRKQEENTVSAIERAIERVMLDAFAKESKIRWAEHVMPFNDNRWIRAVSDWVPRDIRRTIGRPPTRWSDFFTKSFKENYDALRVPRERRNHYATLATRSGQIEELLGPSHSVRRSTGVKVIKMKVIIHVNRSKLHHLNNTSSHQQHIKSVSGIIVFVKYHMLSLPPALAFCIYCGVEKVKGAGQVVDTFRRAAATFLISEAHITTTKPLEVRPSCGFGGASHTPSSVDIPYCLRSRSAQHELREEDSEKIDVGIHGNHQHPTPPSQAETENRLGFFEEKIGSSCPIQEFNGVCRIKPEGCHLAENKSETSSFVRYSDGWIDCESVQALVEDRVWTVVLKDETQPTWRR